VRQLAFEHVGDDLHVAVTVYPEALRRLHAIFVDHAQRPESHVRRIVVVGEPKRVPAVEPPMVGPSAIFRCSSNNHSFPLELTSPWLPPEGGSHI
jgi:hypothetical protein